MIEESIITQITIYSSDVKKAMKFVEDKKKEGFDRIETNYGSGKTFKDHKMIEVKLTKLEYF